MSPYVSALHVCLICLPYVSVLCVQEAEEFKLSIFDESRTSAANAASSTASSAGSEDGSMVQTIVFDQPQGRLPCACLNPNPKPQTLNPKLQGRPPFAAVSHLPRCLRPPPLQPPCARLILSGCTVFVYAAHVCRIVCGTGCM